MSPLDSQNLTEQKDLPLLGKRILVTRPGSQGEDFALKLRKLGAEPILMPMIEFTKPDSWEALDSAIANIDLYQWLFSYESGWQNISQGGTFEAVNSDDIRNLLLPIPLPQEQQKIASCLLSLDEIIKAESKKLGALKEHKKGLLQNLFPQNGETVPKLRFKEFEDSGEWEKNTMEEICKITSGGTPSRTVNDYWNGEIPWISTTLIDFNTINAANEYITEAGLQNSSAKIFPKNTILMAMYGQGKTRGKVAILGIEAATNQA